MKRTLLFKWTGAISTLAGLLVLLVYLLLATDRGSAWLLSVTARHFIPSLQWQQVEGTLMKGIKLSKLRVTQETQQLSIDQLSGSWDLLSLLGGQFTLARLELTGVHIAQRTAQQSATHGSWPRLATPLAIHFKQISVRNIRLEQQPQPVVIDELLLAGRIGPRGLRLDQGSLILKERQLQVTGAVRAKEPYPLDLKLSWQISPPQGIALQGVAEITGTLEQLKFSHQLQNPVALTSQGQIDTGFNPQRAAINPAAFTADISHHWHWRDFQPPGAAFPFSSNGEAHTHGAITALQIDSSFTVATEWQGRPMNYRVTLAAQRDQQQIEVMQLQLSGEAGTVTGRGRLAWQPELRWDFTLNGQHLNPGFFSAEWPGQLTAQLHTQGSLARQQLEWQSRIEALHGELRGHPLSASGQVALQNNRYHVEQLQLKMGANRINLTATLTDQLNARWRLEAADLTAFHPELSGSLHSTGSLQGSLQQPHLQMQLDAGALRFRDYQLEKLQLSASRQEGVDDYRLQLEATEIRSADNRLRSLSLQAQGNPQDHHYRINIIHPQAQSQLAGSGAWQATQAQWQGEINSWTIDSALFGGWQLADPVQLRASEGSLAITAICLMQRHNSLCTRVDYDAEKGIELTAQSSELDLALLSPWLPQATELSGQMDFQLQLHGHPAQLKGNLEVNLPSVIITPAALTTDARFQLERVHIKGALAQQRLQVNGGATLTDTGHANWHLELPIDNPDGFLQGELELVLDELGWLGPFSTAIEQPTGQVNLALSLSGSIRDPVFAGRAALTEFAAFIPASGSAISDGTLTLTPKETNQWALHGELTSGDGSLAMDGHLSVANLNQWLLEISLNGKRLPLHIPDRIQGELTPQLDLTLDPQQLTLRGTVLVPRADIELHGQRNHSLQVSPDEIILEDTVPADNDSKPGRRSTIDLSINLGDNVGFQGFGVTGKLGGNLRLQQSTEQAINLAGVVEIQQGQYQAFGQQLAIKQGRLIFQGPPTQPLVDIRITRQAGDHLVGLQVNGTPDTLISEPFSQPPLPPTEIIPLLLTGKPLAQLGQSEVNPLLSAASSLGLRHSAVLTQRLQQLLGVDLLRVSSDSGIEQSAVTIGKYLTPKLFIRYEQGILTPSTNASLEYSINEHLKVKAQSGDEQSMDILYQIHR